MEPRCCALLSLSEKEGVFLGAVGGKQPWQESSLPPSVVPGAGEARGQSGADTALSPEMNLSWRTHFEGL